jgi:hypothetical protein
MRGKLLGYILISSHGVTGMFRTERTGQLADTIFQRIIKAPDIVRNTPTGKFTGVRKTGRREFIPFTITAIRKEGTRDALKAPGKTGTLVRDATCMTAGRRCEL